MSDKTANIVIGIVTAVWAGNIIAGVAQINDYQPSESLNGVFMAIVGGAFALRAKAKSADKDDDEPDERPRKKKPRQ